MYEGLVYVANIKYHTKNNKILYKTTKYEKEITAGSPKNRQ